MCFKLAHGRLHNIIKCYIPLQKVAVLNIFIFLCFKKSYFSLNDQENRTEAKQNRVNMLLAVGLNESDPRRSR